MMRDKKKSLDVKPERDEDLVRGKREETEGGKKPRQSSELVHQNVPSETQHGREIHYYPV